LAQKRTCKPTEDPKLNPHGYSNLILDKGAKKYNRKNTASLTSDARKTEYPHVID
jgi:hypothetical protein